MGYWEDKINEYSDSTARNKELARVDDVIAARKEAGLSTHDQEVYRNKIAAIGQGATDVGDYTKNANYGYNENKSQAAQTGRDVSTNVRYNDDGSIRSIWEIDSAGDSDRVYRGEEPRPQQQPFDAKDIYDQIMGLMPKDKNYKYLTFEEAMAKSKGQINPMYDSAMNDAMKKLDQQAVKSGFYGQLPAESVKRNVAANIELDKTRAVTDLAEKLKGLSMQEADTAFNKDMQRQKAQLDTLLSALGMYNDTTQYGNSLAIALENLAMNKERLDMEKSNNELNQELSIANVTGMFRNNPTIAYEQLLQQMTNDQAKTDQYIKESNASISQAWERIKNDANSAGFKNETDYKNSIYSTAYNLALDYYDKIGRDLTSLSPVEWAEFSKKVDENVKMLTGTDVLKENGLIK